MLSVARVEVPAAIEQKSAASGAMPDGGQGFCELLDVPVQGEAKDSPQLLLSALAGGGFAPQRSPSPGSKVAAGMTLDTMAALLGGAERGAAADPNGPAIVAFAVDQIASRAVFPIEASTVAAVSQEGGVELETGADAELESADHVEPGTKNGDESASTDLALPQLWPGVVAPSGVVPGMPRIAANSMLPGSGEDVAESGEVRGGAPPRITFGEMSGGSLHRGITGLPADPDTTEGLPLALRDQTARLEPGGLPKELQLGIARPDTGQTPDLKESAAGRMIEKTPDPRALGRAPELNPHGSGPRQPFGGSGPIEQDKGLREPNALVGAVETERDAPERAQPAQNVAPDSIRPQLRVSRDDLPSGFGTLLGGFHEGLRQAGSASPLWGSSEPLVPAGQSSDVDRPVSFRDLGVAIAARAQQGESRFDVRLDPPELGKINVRLEVDREGQVRTHLVVERVDTLDLLRREAPNLERMLQSSGLKTDGGLDVSLRDSSGGGGQTPRQTWAGPVTKMFAEVPAGPDDQALNQGARFLRRGLDIQV